MLTKRLTMRAVAGLTLWAGFGAAAQAQLRPVTPEWAFGQMPRQPGVNITTPTPDQVPHCKVEPIPSPQDPKTPMGFVVRDAVGRPVRQFVSYDNKTFNIIAFYVNGTEAYREVYPPQAGVPYQFRWLGPNGTKWGTDHDRDGKIDEWAVISPEELSQELLQAVLTKDENRAKALVVTKANLDAIGLQGAEAQKILDRAANAAKQVGPAAEGLKAGAEARWDHLQLGIPQSTPADALKARDDLISHKSGTILVHDGANMKSLQTGEMIQVGRAWKLVDGPSAGVAVAGGGPNGGPVVIEKIKGFVANLDKLDRDVAPTATTPPLLAAYNAQRAAILEQIIAEVPDDHKEAWTKLLLDSLSAATEGEKLDGKYLFRLKQFKDVFAGKPGPIGAYAWWRFILAENSITLNIVEPGKMKEAQEKWRATLEEFIKANAKAEDTPEATLRLAMAFEFLNNKEGDAEAKKWYAALAANHPTHPHAAKATGAVKRLDSEGQPLAVTGPVLGTGQAFNVTALSGKVVIVYYWASWSSTLAEDSKKLKALLKDYGPKGLEVVSVCLDADSKAAAAAVNTHGVPGTVLHAPGGLDGSPLSAQYGIVVVPHLMIAGKDGKVVNRNAQTTTAEDDVKKLLP